MSSQSADRGDTLVRIGAVVFGAGSIATLVTFVPLFFHLPRFPSIAYWLCMLMPLGFLISLAGLLTSARAQKRRTAARYAPAGQAPAAEGSTAQASAAQGSTAQASAAQGSTAQASAAQAE